MTVLDIHAILEHLPHRYPLLLVDRVIELELGKRIVTFLIATMRRPSSSSTTRSTSSSG